MIALVQALQAVSGAVWLLPLALLTPALWRVLRAKASRIDIVRAPWFFAAAVMVLGAARWLFYPATLPAMQWNEMAFWAVIYIVSIGAAAGVTCSLALGEPL